MMWNNCGYGMMGWGFGGFMFFFILLIIIAIGIIIFLLLRNNKGINIGYGSNEASLEILKKRYVKGEITKEDFEKMKKDIEIL